MQFHLENAKARASQRMREDRAKPIDLLARDILLWDMFTVGEEPPYKMFDSMPLSEVRDIREEILEYQVNFQRHQQGQFLSLNLAWATDLVFQSSSAQSAG